MIKLTTPEADKSQEETLEQREISEKEAQRTRDQLNKGSTGDYIRDKDI